MKKIEQGGARALTRTRAGGPARARAGRTAVVTRGTKETNVEVRLAVDGSA